MFFILNVDLYCCFNIDYYSGCFRWRSQLDKENVKPLMAGMVPLCSYQYERQFNTTRIPGIERDRIVKMSDSRHIAVHHKGDLKKHDINCKRFFIVRLLSQE